MEIVQRRSESDCTVILSPLTIFDVLTKPPNLISKSAGIDSIQIYRTSEIIANCIAAESR
jgi:hypothetical protein